MKDDTLLFTVMLMAIGWLFTVIALSANWYYAIETMVKGACV